MASTTNPATTRVAIAPIEGHRTFTAAADGTRTCQCGYNGTAAGLASHQDLARMGIQVGPTGALLNNTAGAQIAPVVDYATLEMRREIAGLRIVAENRAEEIADLRLQLEAAKRKAAVEEKRRVAAETKLAAERGAVTELQLALQGADFENRRLRALEDLAFSWRIAAGPIERACAESNLVNAIDESVAYEAAQARDANADDFDCEAAAASFGDPLTADRIMSEADQLDHAGANPSRPL